VLVPKIFKILITDLDELKQRLRTSGPSWIMSSLRQPFVSDIVDRWRLVKRLLQYSSRSVINCIQILQFWRPQLRWNKLWSYFI